MSGMTETRVLELIEAYGPEPAGWPDAEREAAETLLRETPDVFAEALADARALDSALAAMPEPELPEGLAARIINSAPKAETGAGLLSRLKSQLAIGGRMWPSATAAASTAFGLIIGYSALGATQVASLDIAEEAAYAAFDSGYELNWDEAGQ